MFDLVWVYIWDVLTLIHAILNGPWPSECVLCVPLNLGLNMMILSKKAIVQSPNSWRSKALIVGMY